MTAKPMTMTIFVMEKNSALPGESRFYLSFEDRTFYGDGGLILTNWPTCFKIVENVPLASGTREHNLNIRYYYSVTDGVVANDGEHGV